MIPVVYFISKYGDRFFVVRNCQFAGIDGAFSDKADRSEKQGQTDYLFNDTRNALRRVLFHKLHCNRIQLIVQIRCFVYQTAQYRCDLCKFTVFEDRIIVISELKESLTSAPLKP